MASEHRPIVDWRAAAPLASGYLAAECVGPDGEVWPWLVAPLCPACEDEATHGNRNVVPVHERTGKLPREIREALGLLYRCAGRTRQGAGRPCRIIVSEPGGYCGQHANQRQVA